MLDSYFTTQPAAGHAVTPHPLSAHTSATFQKMVDHAFDEYAACERVSDDLRELWDRIEAGDFTPSLRYAAKLRVELEQADAASAAAYKRWQTVRNAAMMKAGGRK